MKPFPVKSRSFCPARLASFGLIGLAVSCLSAVQAAPPTGIRIVGCDQPVQSKKRGVCANRLEAADFAALEPGVSWWYNWHHTTSDPKPKNARMEFLPMAWGHNPASLAGLEKYLAAGNRPRQVLAINEPNLRGQAFLTPQQAASLYARVKAVADKYRIPVAGPQMALGSSASDSITAFDPLENKETTYTFMVPFEKAFLHYAKGTPVRATSLHSYGPFGEMRWAVETMYKEFRRPVWVTEYAHVPDAAQGMTYLMQATDFLERTPYVEGYAWFKERGPEADYVASLLQKQPGKLTPMGIAYVSMPVHDGDLYYRIPGRLQAEKYVRLNKAEIWPTTDGGDGFAQMTSDEKGAILAYNVQADKAGTYTLRLRTSGEAGKIDVLRGKEVLGSVASGASDADARSWQTLTTNISLPAGPQTIHVRFATKGQTMNWMEFERR